MIRDFLKIPPQSKIEKNFDICIIGGGTAGIYLAQKLIKQDIRVVILELGSLKNYPLEDNLKPAEHKIREYLGSKKGRFSGLGGTSSKWGGQMISLKESDFINSPNHKDGKIWAITEKDIWPFYKKVEKVLNLKSSYNNYKINKVKSHFESLDIQNFFEIRMASWISFKKKNFAKGFYSKLLASNNLEIWLNSKVDVANNSLWENNNLENIIISDEKKRKLLISAKQFVFACGAIESTGHTNTILEKFTNSKKLKYPLCDHLSVKIGTIKIKNMKLFREWFLPIIDNGTMKTLRFETNNKLQKSLKVSSGFIHFQSSQVKGSGIELIRRIFRKIQDPDVKINIQEFRVDRILLELIEMFYWRFVKARVLLFSGEKISLYLDIEQRPNELNFIKFNNQKAQICWDVLDNDIVNFKVISEHFIDNWNKCDDLLKLGEIKKIKDFELNNIHDVYHPTGLLSFGTRDKERLLDDNLKIKCTDNVYVTSTAVFPTSGSANPGFTHLALTERLGEYLKSLIRIHN